MGDSFTYHRAPLLNTLRPIQEMWDGHLGNDNATCNRIQIDLGARPVSKTFYRAVPAHLRAEQDNVQTMLDQGAIEFATAAWDSPIVMASKKDRSLRFCVDPAA